MLCPQCGLARDTPELCGDTSVGAVLSAAMTRVPFGVFWWHFGDSRAHLCVPMAALLGTQWPLFAFGAGEQPLAWEEQSPEPVPANTKHAFLSLHDKLVCQQQEVMFLPSSPRGNSSWFPWGCMQLESYRFIQTESPAHAC